MKPRAAGYYRVSTPGQAERGLSLADQRATIQAFIKDKGFTPAGEYEDGGKTAVKDYRTRPAFRTMLADAIADKFDVLVCVDVSRFSRNPRDYFDVAAQLDQLGVLLVTTDNPAFDPADDGQVLGREMQVVLGKFTARQSRAKSIRVRERRIANGGFNLGQRIPYGLRWKDKEGTALEYDPDTYAVWRLIVHLRLTCGWGYGRIAAALNGHEPVEPAVLAKHGVKLPVKNRWGMKLWREGAIAGMFRDDGRATGEMGLRFQPLRGAAKELTVKYPPLLSRAEFDKAGKLTKKKLTWVPRNVGKGSLLSGMCKCAVCGASLQVTGSRGHSHYACANRLRPPHGRGRCGLPLIPKAKLEWAVLSRVAEFLEDDKAFERALAAANVGLGKSRSSVAALERERGELDKRAADIQVKQKRLIDAVADGLLPGNVIKPKQVALTTELLAVERHQADLADRLAAFARDRERAVQVQQARQDMRRRWGRLPDLTDLPDDAKRDLLRSLLPADDGSRIVVRPGEQTEDGYEYGRWEIDVEGMLPVDYRSIKKVVLGGAVAAP